MFNSFTRRAAPLVVLALGASLSGCAYIVGDWDEVDGVTIGDLDMSGDAPDTIELAGPDKVIITEGEGLTITLEGDEQASEALRFDRNGGELTIARDRSIFDGSGTALVRITMPAPKNLEIAGSGDIEAAALAKSAEVDIAGSGNVTVNTLEADDLEIDIAGSGTVSASGTAKELDISVAGNGDVKFADVMADTVSISIAGSGDVALSSNGSVSASIAGSGDVVVTGSASCTVSSAGSGSLTCRPAPEQTAEAATEGTEEDAAGE